MGLSPTTPQNAAGCRIDPPVSEPSASGAHRAATATADPPLDPPGVRSLAHGLRTGPYAEFSFDDPIANSSQFALPMMTAPAASMRCTAVASYGGTNRSRMREEAVVRTPRTHRLSFTAMGTPMSGPADAPFARCRSISSARASARSAVTRLNALSDGFCASIRSRNVRHTSTADTVPAAISSRIARALLFSTSTADHARYPE